MVHSFSLEHVNHDRAAGVLSECEKIYMVAELVTAQASVKGSSCTLLRGVRSGSPGCERTFLDLLGICFLR